MNALNIYVGVNEHIAKNLDKRTAACYNEKIIGQLHRKNSPGGIYMSSKVISIIVYVIEIIGSIVLAIILALWDEITISKGIAALSTDISVLIITSQFLESGLFSDLESELKSSSQALLKKAESIESDVKIDELFKRIYMVNDEQQRNIYIKSLETFVSTMMSRIDGARSGALSRIDYYNELNKAGNMIVDDNNAHHSNYSGEIWAMTFWCDDELDLSDESEAAWVAKMESMDKMGIKTRRLCVMKDKKGMMTRESLDEVTDAFLLRIKYYCEKNRTNQNTTVYAIESIDSLSVKEQEWIGKGFFAIKLHTGELHLIRGVSMDNPNATTLGGEIDFDVARVSEIRTIWERLITLSGERTITQYLSRIASPAIKSRMIELGFDDVI